MYKQIEDIFRELTQIDKAILDESRPLGIDISEVVTQIKGDCTNFLQKIHQQRTTDPI